LQDQNDTTNTWFLFQSSVASFPPCFKDFGFCRLPIAKPDRGDIVLLAVKRPAAILGSGVFMVIAPGSIAVLFPYWICRWQMAPPLLGFIAFRALGALLICVGFPVLIDSFYRFAAEGLGTPAPVAPPTRLVVGGLYRYVRNPMYVAVSSLVVGQGVLFGSIQVLKYGVLVIVGFHLFVLLYEEPTLRDKFGRRVRQLLQKRATLVAADESMGRADQQVEMTAGCLSSAAI
jgi:protein-S-isoprenylcysteine O-methyltransferase Ste14